MLTLLKFAQVYHQVSRWPARQEQAMRLMEALRKILKDRLGVNWIQKLPWAWPRRGEVNT